VCCLAFSIRRDFKHNGQEYSFVPSEHFALEKDIFAGFIGRKITQNVNEGPEQLFAKTKAEHYKAAFFAIDIGEGEQLACMERRADVGNSERILSSLMREVFISSGKSTGWHTDIEYLTKPDSFWEAVEKNRGAITTLEFEFYPANGLSGFDAWKSFDKVIQKSTNAQSSRYAINNNEGNLQPEGEEIEKAIEYAAEGGGFFKLLRGKRVLFSSRSARKTESAAKEIMPDSAESSKIPTLIQFLFRGRKL
jgi:hypothetical protein